MTNSTVICVGCGAQKQRAPWRGPAIELYLGTLFRRRLAYARHLGGPHVVLSGKYGPLRPTDIVEPYDEYLRDGERYAAACLDALRRWTAPGDAVVVLASARYTAGWLAQLEGEGRAISAPLAGMGLVQQMAWMRDQMLPPHPQLSLLDPGSGGAEGAQ